MCFWPHLSWPPNTTVQPYFSKCSHTFSTSSAEQVVHKGLFVFFPGKQLSVMAENHTKRTKPIK